jgi:hypothetical protein
MLSGGGGAFLGVFYLNRWSSVTPKATRAASETFGKTDFSYEPCTAAKVFIRYNII